MTRTVKLREERDGSDYRFLDAHLSDDGDLVLTGQDIGPSVELFFGEDEYEWVRTVEAEHVPALLLALGAEADADVLDVLECLPAPDGSYQIEQLLRDEVVPYEIHVF
jgi:hypothetical protein